MVAPAASGDALRLAAIPVSGGADVAAIWAAVLDELCGAAVEETPNAREAERVIRAAVAWIWMTRLRRRRWRRMKLRAMPMGAAAASQVFVLII